MLSGMVPLRFMLPRILRLKGGSDGRSEGRHNNDYIGVSHNQAVTNEQPTCFHQAWPHCHEHVSLTVALPVR